MSRVRKEARARRKFDIFHALLAAADNHSGKHHAVFAETITSKKNSRSCVEYFTLNWKKSEYV